MTLEKMNDKLEIRDNIGASKKEWFGEWFDSPYYHILYRHRNFEEACHFIDRICDEFQISVSDKILDLACGKGRHAIYLNKKGFDVQGVDLSIQNILAARKYENERLKFFVHDMREPFKKEAFDWVLNIFTSFGYFETEEENEMVVRYAARSLKKYGRMLLDFLNPFTVIRNLVEFETKEIEGIRFKISRAHKEDGFIYKNIRLRHNGKEITYQEKVKAIRRHTFMKYFDRAGLELTGIYGNYQLDKYDPERSDRMIFLLRKNS